jgi:hypothetical protein
MRRKQIPQLINTKWFPRHIRKLCSEFLSCFVLKVNATKPFIPVIESALIESKKNNIINLEFNDIGAGIETVKPFLNQHLAITSIPLSEINTQQQRGMYLFVNSFHQLPAINAKKTLEEIAKSGNPVVVVEGNNDSLWQLVGMTIFLPVAVILSAPFVKPFRWSRILFTYIIPILPVIMPIDGCIGLLKLYNPKDLNKLTSSIKVSDYKWTAGKEDNGRGGKIIYLTGISTA